ncbi:glycosyltransferase family 2 protein [Salinimicrobium oceani]|uniref:Glycosyltransferase n=1 Tax=Salinimicrobium oceani TaxID=2722702 RepID=A0ABX1D4F1_9FLAO|nr:glycosyltransferase [Salinimicrobium oceani]NJW53426.1 glycosyltransferase [Salinimicrobium oceani]
MKSGFRFAAFVMTYERPDILINTLRQLQGQSLPPEIIIVVDNSDSNETSQLLDTLNFEKVNYLRVGYNSGPAGAAKIGLEKLTAMGYQWIYWGDDDDPPASEQDFEILFGGIEILQRKGVKLGIFGGKGGRLNRLTGRISSLSNKELKEAPYLDVDLVPGGQNMLVNAEVVKAGILPDERLFFGFEELDFCLKVKSAGFKIYIDADNWFRTRVRSGNVAKNYRWRDHSFGNREYLQREFYSTRNLLQIYYRHKFFFAFFYFLLKSIAKMVLGYRFGRNYGKKMFLSQWKALKAFVQQDFSRRLKPN